VAVRTLGYWDNMKSIDTLVKVAGNPTYRRRVRDLALDSLCKLEAPEAIELMCDALRTNTVDLYTRRNCAWALGNIGNTGPLELLEAIAKGRSDKEVRDAAKQAIAQLRHPEGAWTAQ
jgi:HEAT repeat protein